MHILVTNDDGVMAAGLLALVQAMRQVGEVSVVAPDHNWSAGGHVKTLHRPLRVQSVTLDDGTVALANLSDAVSAKMGDACDEIAASVTAAGGTAATTACPTA